MRPLPALLLLAGLLPAQDAAAPPRAERPWNIFRLGDALEAALHGDLWTYHIRTRNTYYSSRSAALTEFTARLGADLSIPGREWISGKLRLAAEGVLGRPENWTVPREEGFGALVDLASLTLELGPVSLTGGLQELSFGDGFLINDFHSEKRAVWTTALRSAPALRLTARPAEALTLDMFGLLLHERRLSYEAYLGSAVGIEGGGRLYGANARLERDGLGATDLGLFYKDERIAAGRNLGLDPDSDTLALALRHERRFGALALSAEAVKQEGRTRVVRNAVVPGRRHRRDAWGGNVAATWRFGEAWDAPHLRARYAYFSGDDRNTDRVESFDPFFYGFTDWGTWYLGDMAGFSLTHTNERVASLEFCAWPLDTVRTRLFLYDFTLDRKMPFSRGLAWGREAFAVLEWFPRAWLFLGVMAGASFPGRAARDFYASGKTQQEAITWVGFTF